MPDNPKAPAKQPGNTVDVEPRKVACIHCGRPFYPHESTGGEFGICQDCVDGND